MEKLYDKIFESDYLLEKYMSLPNWKRKLVIAGVVVLVVVGSSIN